LFLEKYQFNEVTKEGFIGFCWCGFCRTRLMVKPFGVALDKTGAQQPTPAGQALETPPMP
jgi:hypothetical protein